MYYMYPYTKPLIQCKVFRLILRKMLIKQYHHAFITEICNTVYWLQSTSQAVNRRACMMGDMHIRNLRQKNLLRQRTEEAVKKLQV